MLAIRGRRVRRRIRECRDGTVLGGLTSIWSRAMSRETPNARENAAERSGSTNALLEAVGWRVESAPLSVWCVLTVP